MQRCFSVFSCTFSLSNILNRYICIASAWLHAILKINTEISAKFKCINVFTKVDKVILYAELHPHQRALWICSANRNDLQRDVSSFMQEYTCDTLNICQQQGSAAAVTSDGSGPCIVMQAQQLITNSIWIIDSFTLNSVTCCKALHMVLWIPQESIQHGFPYLERSVCHKKVIILPNKWLLKLVCNRHSIHYILRYLQ